MRGSSAFWAFRRAPALVHDSERPPPGEYRIQARARGEIGPEAVALPLLVNGVDVDNVSLTTAAGATITGQVVDETRGAPALARDRVRITARLVSGDFDPRTGPAR